MKDEKCIFCKLANGDIPTNSIYEDNDFKVILDADPATKGHALILPKNHFANLLEADDDVLVKALPLAKKIAKNMMDKLGCAGVNIVQNNGEAAGQTVHHLHIHVIPRYEDDPDKTICGWSHQKFTDEETAEVVKKLSM
ncbi:histidine triad (HIT) family protein [Pseudobutyrivibrio sp. NOR37]|uniref:HIT family protein n=2 Tax=Pseudobutyrivibrio TaxID=46205 RepID=A0A2G3ECV2_9FIRM|nr:MULTISPECIES: HIT family protein [Pseudobutyrivibrio]NEX01895.1 HIT family protein [Pseudobutyrivibrio xylanivorans]PHU36575.1 HIT family protein [Pseudobutyrivibrio ruminis]PHU40965.1 HIT family protein [Pseudobutyrivibrio ruminis]SFR72610.1 histidine triad (HIT) family protein [Pseudobutyrivibrio sp. NOR37]